MTLQPTHPAPGLSSALCPRESGYTSHPLFPVSIDFPRLRAELSEEQAHLGSAGGTWGCASPVPGCRAPAPRSRFPAPQDRGFLVLCPPQPRCGSPRAGSLPRPAAAPALPTIPARRHPFQAGGVPGGVPSVCGSLRRVRARASHPALRGRCTGMLCPPGSVHTVKSNCLKAVVFGFCFLSPVPSHPPGPFPSPTLPGWRDARWPRF